MALKMRNGRWRDRVAGRFQRTMSSMCFRRTVQLNLSGPCISFTFDDFPRSALLTGGEILERFGVRATYYAALGLMGQKTPTGEMFIDEDVERLLRSGHEIGCHTFDHSHSWNTDTRRFEESIRANEQRLSDLAPGARFRSFSYPISGPRPLSKLAAGRRFESCRGGGQTYNSGRADMRLLKAFFMEKSRENPRVAKDLIDQNCDVGGWLIFATHDVAESPTNFGCTPAYFEDIVRYAVGSGARIGTVSGVVDLMG